MSIKPVDHNTIIPKTLELSNAKHIENIKNRNVVESGFIHQDKMIERNKRKVLDVEKNDSSIKIRKDEESKEGSYSQKNQKKSKKQSSKQDKKKMKTRNRIDIRI